MLVLLRLLEVLELLEDFWLFGFLYIAKAIRICNVKIARDSKAVRVIQDCKSNSSY